MGEDTTNVYSILLPGNQLIVSGVRLSLADKQL